MKAYLTQIYRSFQSGLLFLIVAPFLLVFLLPWVIGHWIVELLIGETKELSLVSWRGLFELLVGFFAFAILVSGLSGLSIL